MTKQLYRTCRHSTKIMERGMNGIDVDRCHKPVNGSLSWRPASMSVNLQQDSFANTKMIKTKRWKDLTNGRSRKYPSRRVFVMPGMMPVVPTIFVAREITLLAKSTTPRTKKRKSYCCKRKSWSRHRKTRHNLSLASR